MKRFSFLIFVAILTASLFAQSGTLSFHQYCVAGYSYTWQINVNEAKAVKVSYQIDIAPGIDNIVFFDVNSSGGTNYSGVYPTGFSSGTYITSTQTGKVNILLYCNASGMKNIEIQYSADNSIITNSNLNVGGNGYILGNLGVGISTPQEKLHVNGAIRGNAAGGAVRLKSQYGFIDIGSQNPGFAHIYTDRSEFAFDKPIDLISGKLTSYTNTNLYLQTGRGTDRLAILNSNGNVGIGTVEPQAKLHVRVIDALEQTAGNYINLTRTQGNGGNSIYVNDYILRETNGNDWYSTSYVRGISIDVSFLDPKTTLRSWIKQTPSDEKIDFGSSGKTYMSIRKDPTTQNALLIVDGTIHAKEVKIDLNNDLADFVFDPTYNLMPLPEVEQFVKTNKHLPEIPSASEVQDKGMNMGEMQNSLLQKIEELTLYVIEQQKQIEQQNKKIKQLENKEK